MQCSQCGIYVKDDQRFYEIRAKSELKGISIEAQVCVPCFVNFEKDYLGKDCVDRIRDFEIIAWMVFELKHGETRRADTRGSVTWEMWISEVVFEKYICNDSPF